MFNPQNEISDTAQATREAFDDALQNLKTAMSDFRKQLSPLADSIQEVASVIRDGARTAKKNLEESANNADNQPNNKPVGETSEPSSSREAAAIITESLAKLKDRAVNTKIDVHDILSREFDQFADKNLSNDEFTVDDQGNRVVKIDGAFIQNHANELIPAMIRGTFGSIFKSLVGKDLTENNRDDAGNIDIAKTTSNDADTNDKTKMANSASEHPYKIQFDFANAISDIIRNAQITPVNPNGAPVTQDEIDTSKEIFAQGAKIAEDALNGKDVSEAGKHLAETIEQAKNAEKSPEEIQAVDEKHRRILEISKEFDKPTP